MGKLDGFLQFHERNVLEHAGRISHELALEHAEEELERYQAQERAIAPTTAAARSDFDRFVSKIEDLGPREDD